jgi:hypothetical protein
LLENNDPLFHLNDPIPCDKGNELLLDSLLGVGVAQPLLPPPNLSLGLLLARTFALAETVGVM